MNIISRLKVPYSPNQLAVFRFFIGAQIIYASSSKIFDLLLFVEEKQNVKTIAPFLFNSNFFISIVPEIRISVIVLSFLLMIGLFTKYVTPLLTVTFILLFGFYYQGVNAPITWLYFWFPLLLLNFSKPSDVLSFDALIYSKKVSNHTNYTWPIELIRVWFVYIYFFAGVTKLIPFQKFIVWTNGETSRDIIYNRFLDSPIYYIFKKAPIDYSTPSIVFSLLSLSAVLLELSTIYILLKEKYSIYILISILSMHSFLYLCGVAGFLQTAIVLGIVVVPNKWFDFKKSK